MNAISSVAAALALVVLSGLSAPATAQPLRVSHVTWVGYGPFYIAVEQGYFDQEGVEVQFSRVSDGKYEFAALAAGRIDLIANSLDAMAIRVADGQSLKVAFALDESYGADGIVATRDIGTIADLRGRSVAYGTGIITEFFLRVVLDSAGLGMDDIAPAIMDPENTAAAFVAGRVDAAVTWEPWLGRIRGGMRGHVLTDTTAWPGLLADVAIARAETVAQRGDELRAFYRAWLRALAFLAANEAEADRMMARGLGGWLEDSAEVAAARAGIRFYGAAENRAYIGTAQDPGSVIGHLERIARLAGIAYPDGAADLVAFDIVNP